MSRYQVISIRRDRTNPECLIEAVEFGGQVHPIEDAMRWLNSSPDNQLWVMDDRGRSVWVSSRQHSRTGRYFLTTERDGNPLNMLATLPECRTAECRTDSAFRFPDAEPVQPEVPTEKSAFNFGQAAAAFGRDRQGSRL